MSDEYEIERARLAQDVLANPVYLEAFDLVEKEIIQTWRDARNPKDREQLHQLLLLLPKSRAVLEQAVRTGQLAKASLVQKQTLAARIGQRLSSG